MATPSVLWWIALLGVLSVLHVVFWRWKLAAPTREDERLRARTGDGWSLSLGRRLPRGEARAPPVLLVHGIAMNRHAFDFGIERWSVARHLSEAGFDCFTLELRGHGRSRRGSSRRWSLDDYLRQDVPAALDAVRAATGSARVLWVGHSQGALLGMTACALYPERIAALVALAPPARIRAGRRMEALASLATGPGRRLRPIAWLAAPFSGSWQPQLLGLTVNLANVEPRVWRRFLANGVEDLQPGVLSQFADFARAGSFRSADGKVDYGALFAGCRQPALFVSAGKDGLTPPPAVEAGHDAWGGPKRLRGLGDGYGHTDILLGRHAPEEVFPAIRDFLLEQAEASLSAEAARP